MRHLNIVVLCAIIFTIGNTITWGSEHESGTLPENIAEKLPKHPRLFLTKEKEDEIRKAASNDPFMQKQIRELFAKADKLQKERNSEYRIPDGMRLLSESRRSIDRTTAFAFAFRMTGRKDYLDSALSEMQAVCRFKDWNPSHYLDTAEMCTAVALGYDWLYDEIPEENRKEFREAIVKLALKTGLDVYEKKSWWSTSANNWNEVCNAGLTLGALAVAEDEPELAQKIMQFAFASIPRGLSVNNPDGAYPEGPGGYWAYGTTYSCLLIAALQSTLESDFGLLQTPGLSKSGNYYISMVGPTGLCFNYADGGEGAGGSPILYYFASNYNRPDFAAWYAEMLNSKKRFASDRFAVFNVIWYNDLLEKPDGAVATDANALNSQIAAWKEKAFAKTQLASIYKGKQDVVSMRTSWNDPNAGFLGFKAGDNTANHGHLDIGSFVYEIDGVRWASDLGGDDYNMPDYFGNKRWDYFRNNNRSHSTLVIGGNIQQPKAISRIVEFDMGIEDGIARAVCDMTAAYADQATSALRAVTLKKDGSLVIEDVLRGVAEPVRWGMVTRSDIRLDETAPKTAMLQSGGKKLIAEIVSEQVEKFEIASMKPPQAIENQNQGVRMLAATAIPENDQVKIVVTLRKK